MVLRLTSGWPSEVATIKKWLVVSACSVAATFAVCGEAYAADPVVLLCRGSTLTEGGYLDWWSYYKIADGVFMEWNNTSVGWSVNECPIYQCKFDENEYNLRQNNEKDDQVSGGAEINRKTGQIKTWIADGDKFFQSSGTCAPSADPAPASAPNRF